MTGEPLIDADEVLFRQIHPSFLDNGKPSSQPFLPTTKDQDKLSVDRSSLTDAASSYALFTGAGHLSASVYGLTVGEFRVEALACLSDPLAAVGAEPANPAHAYADYSGHSLSQQKAKAKRLKQTALARGCLYP